MATTKFTAGKIRQLRWRVWRAGRLPEDLPQGWFKSPIDPMRLLRMFKPLRMRDGWVLRAYQFHQNGNGNGAVWALPVDADFPEPAACRRSEKDFLATPRPGGALDDYMEAIDGDGTPWSYMCASILARELAELGALWHGRDWAEHSLLDHTSTMTSSDDWHWKRMRPAEWRPRVSDTDTATRVTFFTFSPVARNAIYRHDDTYLPGRYSFAAKRSVVATRPGGLIF